MSSTADRVLEAVRAGGLLTEGRRVLVMLSGGRDSTCLLDVAVRLAGRDAVRVLHVNYGLRASAGGDESHCCDLCARLGVELAVERAPVPAPERGNLQAWARELRYAAAIREAEPGEAVIATGHTASDQAETVLYRLASSPGRLALLGMSPVNGRLVRPLLGVTREETGAYCLERGLPWRDDESNESDVYARGRVREALVPGLRRVHPAAEANVVRTAALLREETEALEWMVDEVLGGDDRIELDRLTRLPLAMRRLVARRLAEAAAGRPVPAAAARVEELTALRLRPGSSGLDLGDGLRALVEYGVLRFASAAQAPPPAPVVLEVPGTVRFGEFEVTCHPAGAPARPVAGDPWEEVLDADRLGARLLVRARHPGDRMSPLGLPGTRSLQDLMSDRHVPRQRRGALPVVESGGEIAWVAGVAVGERFRLRPGTRRAVRLAARSPV